jgi:predicted RNase H-like HicB family nuclease
MKSTIEFQKTEECFSVFCLDLPGCWSQGDSKPEALDKTRDAIKEYPAAVAQSYRQADVHQVEAGVK